MLTKLAQSFCAIVLLLGSASVISAQDRGPAATDQENTIDQQIGKLRSLPDGVRAQETKSLALEIRQLPNSPGKLGLANDLANLSTEGDFGRGVLQEVTTTLAEALNANPVPPDKNGEPQEPYMELAQLVKYEHMEAKCDSAEFSAAMEKLNRADETRAKADFTLIDLNGTSWTLRQLRGKVVLVNFWATWCPPCRKEIPTLDALYNRFKDQGFVVLAISAEEASKVKPFIAEEKVSYPVLLDPGGKVNKLFEVEGIPKSFVYDRDGKLVAESIDMRTEHQFLAMLAQAGLQ